MSEQPAVTSKKRPYAETVEDGNDDLGDAEPAGSVTSSPLAIPNH